MAPEHVRGLPADHRADIFAFGCILYEMLGGRRAFSGATPADTMSAVLNTDPPELVLPHAPIPPALFAIVRRCPRKLPHNGFTRPRISRCDTEYDHRVGGNCGSSRPLRLCKHLDTLRGADRRDAVDRCRRPCRRLWLRRDLSNGPASFSTNDPFDPRRGT